MTHEDLDLTADDLVVRSAIRALVARDIEPQARRLDETEAFPAEALSLLAEQGYVGLLVPEADGGGGGSLLQYCLVMEEISRGCAATGATFMTQVHGLLPILIAGNEQQRQRWLPPLISAERISSIAVTEPEAGSDVASLRMTASRVGDGYVLNGRKMFITNGDHAGLMCVFARTSQDRRHGISAFAVELPRPGVSFGAPLKKMGIRASDTAAVYFDDVFVPADCLLGSEGDGLAVAKRALGEARFSTAAQALGIAARAYDIALAYCLQREQFGSPIFDFQAVQLRLVDMYMAVTSARLMLHAAARSRDLGRLDRVPLDAAMVKVYCSDVAMEVSSGAVSLLGGYGYMRDYEVERLMRDAKITQIYDGTNDINRLNMARIIGRDAAAGVGRGRPDDRA